MFYLADGRKQLYQWDLNRKIICSDASIVEVHFYLTADTTLKVERKYDDNIGDYFDIPNILLQNASPIRLYGCEEGYTKTVYQFSVTSRPKPADYVYTETDIFSLDKVIQESLDAAKASGEFDGYTPQRGIDYWTPQDQAAIQEYINSQIYWVEEDLEKINEGGIE